TVLVAAASAETIAPRLPAGVSREPLGDAGDAVRAKIEADGRRVIVFGGTRVRFGRNASEVRENDLVLRSFLSQERSQSVSGRHGTLLVTRDGVAVRDDGSRL